MDPTWGEEFEEMLPEIESAIKQAAFITIDCEFTGVKNQNTEIPKLQGRKPTVDERYETIRAQKNSGFGIIQLGVCPVVWDGNAGHYMARPFNFFVSPVVEPMFGIDRSVLCQASAIEMLCREGMDFNRAFRSGIRYLNFDEEAQIRENEEKLEIEVRENASIDEEGRRFLERARAEIQVWLDDTSPERYDCCNITVSCSYHKRLLHQCLPDMFPNLMVGISRHHFMQIRGKEDAVQQASRKADRKKKFAKQLKEAIGLRKVIEMITRSHKTIVGHNLLIDLIYIWSQLIAKLPSKLELFRAMVGEKFDRVYDTKFLANMIPEIHSTDSLANPTLSTSLESLHTWANFLAPLEFGLGTSSFGNTDLREALHHKHVRYGTERLHEAGYDAYATARVFLALAARMMRLNKLPRQAIEQGGTKVHDEERQTEAPSESFKEMVFQSCHGMLAVNGTDKGSYSLFY